MHHIGAHDVQDLQRCLEPRRRKLDRLHELCVFQAPYLGRIERMAQHEPPSAEREQMTRVLDEIVERPLVPGDDLQEMRRHVQVADVAFEHEEILDPQPRYAGAHPLCVGGIRKRQHERRIRTDHGKVRSAARAHRSRPAHSRRRRS